MTHPHVTIRMYKGLLGDCFLLRFFDASDPDRTAVADWNVLIDCGVLQFSQNESKLVDRVVDSIARDCGGRLDLVIVTHEHYDHICGFGRGSERFEQITIETLWLAWTERSDDPTAIELRNRHEATRRAMAMAMGMIGARDAARKPAMPVTDEDAADHWLLNARGTGLDGFTGPLGHEHANALGLDGRRAKSSREILEDLKTWAKKTEYLEPGAVIALPFASEIRSFVLGPPRSLNRLLQDSPSYDPDKKETYLRARQDDAESVLRNFAYSEDRGCEYPFASRHRKFTEARAQAIVADETSANDSWARPVCDVLQRYGDAAQDFRRIDDDWQSPIGNLALKLDSDTNNTSLALAFELGRSGKILLFAADAQVGNWLSWHDQSYPATAPAEEQVSAADLLQRTVLYKVGHHGSHNATLRAKGLEMMVHAELAAMVPVVEEVAKKRNWRMPHSELYTRLKEKTAERILRGDIPLDSATKARFAEIGCSVREAADDGSKLGPLWVELDLS
jgi:hypothetical protein